MIVHFHQQLSCNDIPSIEKVQAWVEKTLPNSTQEVSIVMADKNESTKLNEQYRAKAGPTNVLSFPLHEASCLGDIIVCVPIVIQEAIQQNKPVEAHFAHMIIHALLHLTGYDHQNDAQAQEMESKEISILQDLGYANPYL